MFVRARCPRRIVSFTLGLICSIAAAAGSPGPLRADSAPATVSRLPAFHLVDQDGRVFSDRELAGKTWIFDFIFTRCSGPCPVMTSKMAWLQRELARDERVHLASVSVDPEHDVPKVLSGYAREAGALPGKWVFLTGSKTGIFRLSREGFRLGVEEEGVDPRTARPSTLHSTRFVLVDERGGIRGYYDSDDPEALGRLVSEARAVAAGPPQ